MKSKYPYITYQEIDKIAEIIRRENGIEPSYFIDITELAKSLGCEVFEAEFKDPSVSGLVTRGPKGEIIKINKDNTEERKRFTIAHELAHVILHQNVATHVDYRKPYSTYDEDELRKEVQADMLAAAMLMPKELVKQAWKKLNDVNLVATLFRVSRKAATVRLNALGLLE